MRNKILFSIITMLYLASGMSVSATPYAVYCEGDKSFHLLDSSTTLYVGGKLPSNGKTITQLWKIDPDNHSFPEWTNLNSVTTVIIESSFKTVKPTSCFAWFYYFSSLNEITGLTYLNTESVTDMDCMFEGCRSLVSLDLSSFNTKNVTRMGQMFHDCIGLTSLDLSSFNTDKVTSMTSMFDRCTSLNPLDLSSFNTDKVTDMSDMFNNCLNLAEIYVSPNFTVKNVVMSKNMFTDCTKLRNYDENYVDITRANWGYDGYLQLGKILAGMPAAAYCDGDKSFHFLVPNSDLILSGKLENSEETITKLFEVNLEPNYCQGEKNWADVFPAWWYNNSPCDEVTKVMFEESFKNVLPTCCINWFDRFQSLTEIEGLQFFNTENVTNMASMFGGCCSLTSLNLSSFNTENVTNMFGMFNNCVALNSLDLSRFNTGKVTDMTDMFGNCSALTSIDLSSFNTSSVTSMQGLFEGCSALTSIDLSNLNTSNVTIMTDMFKDCSALTSLDLSSLNTEKIATSGSYIFPGCSALVSINISGFRGYMLEDLYKSNVPNLRTLITGTFNQTDFLRTYGGQGGSLLIFVNEDSKTPEDKTNVVIGDKCEHLVISYGTTTNNQLYWQTPRNFTADKVTINREFVKDRPSTLYLPFAMDASKYGTFYTCGELNEAGDMVIFTEVTDAQTTADVPYMFIPNDDFPNGITIEGEVAVTNLTGETETAGLQGVYAKKEFTADEAAQKTYYGWANGEFLWAEEGAKIDACRAYFRLPESAVAKAPARIKVKFVEGGMTGVTEVGGEDSGIDSPLYNLNGQRVGKDYRGIVVKKGAKSANFTR